MKKQWKFFKNAMVKMFAAAPLIIMLPLTAHANTVKEPLDSPPEVYQYKVTADSPEWKNLKTVGDKIAACRISKEELTEMSDTELIQAVMDFPFLIEIFAYDDPVTGVINRF